MPSSRALPCIGISSNFMHADPQRPVFKGMTLQYVEERLALAVHRAGAMPVGLPDLKDPAASEALLARVDGLVLSGGADLSPTSYGEEPLRPEWSGDAIRDTYELALVQGARARGLPILGVCRGIQLLNVALGGTINQNLVDDHGTNSHRRIVGTFEGTEHDIDLNAGSLVAKATGEEVHEARCHHHQAIDRLGDGLVVTASARDGVPEAIELEDDDRWVLGVQWHPEAGDKRQLFSAFAQAAAQRADSAALR